MNLTDQQIQQFTKGIVKHCILPSLKNIFDCPEYTGMSEACLCMPDARAIYDAWLDQENHNIDVQILKIYSDIEDGIKEHLKEVYGL